MRPLGPDQLQTLRQDLLAAVEEGLAMAAPADVLAPLAAARDRVTEILEGSAPTASDALGRRARGALDDFHAWRGRHILRVSTLL